MNHFCRSIYTSIVPSSVRLKVESKLVPAVPRVCVRNQFLFIHIPKTAGKSVGAFVGIRKANHRTLSQYAEILGEEVLSDYYLFSVVRHPYDRIRSAWFYVTSGGNGSAEDRKVAKRLLEFESLDNFICEGLVGEGWLSDVFFAPQWEFLTLNGRSVYEEVNVFRFESLSQVQAAIPEKLHKMSVLPKMNVTQRQKKTLSDRSRNVVRDVYESDFVEFGYSV